MLEPPPILGPGTVDDLITDARLLGRKATQRMVIDWQELGLMDYPQPQAGLGRGRGRAKSLYTSNQRTLFRELIRKRPGVGKIASLACIPVYLWAYWGEGYVPLRQTRRAMRTHLRAFTRPSRDGSRQLAADLVGQLAHPDAHETARRRAERLVADSMRDGDNRNDREIEAALLNIYDPYGSGRQAGPPGAPIDVDVVVKTAIAREVAVRKLLDTADPVPDAVFEQARARMADGLREYLHVRPELAAAAGDMAHLFAAPTAREIVQGSCSTLTTSIGLILKPRP